METEDRTIEDRLDRIEGTLLRIVSFLDRYAPTLERLLKNPLVARKLKG